MYFTSCTIKKKQLFLHIIINAQPLRGSRVNDDKVSRRGELMPRINYQNDIKGIQGHGGSWSDGQDSAAGHSLLAARG